MFRTKNFVHRLYMLMLMFLQDKLCLTGIYVVLFPQNNGVITWKVIQDLYNQRIGMHGFYLTKLTREHVELTTFSKMKVRLAAQVSYNFECIFKLSKGFNYEKWTCEKNKIPI